MDCCGGACSDLSSDAQNCGACGVACGPCEICTGSVCASLCQPDEMCVNGLCVGNSGLCDGAMVDFQTSDQNCGGCNNACAAHEQCMGGLCVCPTEGAIAEPICDDQCGFTMCGAGCVDMLFDPRHCGGGCDALEDCSTLLPGRREGCLFGLCCGAGSDPCDPTNNASNCCTGRCGADGTCCSDVLNDCNTPGVSGGDCCDGACSLDGHCCRTPGQPCAPGYHMCCTGSCTPEGVCDSGS
jgi:hypothetical protein